jgi:membrane-bound lytic murein transglycosylase D
LFAVAICLSLLGSEVVFAAAGPTGESGAFCSRYSLPASLLEKPLYFAGELIPLQRQDVRSRIQYQMNFLLLDARSVLTDWLTEKARYSWVLEELLAKESIPKDFVLLSPVLSGLNARLSVRGSPAGWWYLTKPCTSAEGIAMSDDAWHDDRLDPELSTRCFGVRLKEARKQMGGGWLMATAAYITSVKTVQDLCRAWHTEVFWDLPLPDYAEELIVRWIAFGIINGNREAFGLNFKNPPPITFDQVTELVLTKDLPLAEIARITGVQPREILELNPKIKPSSPMFPAKDQGKELKHSMAVPKGKGRTLLHKLMQDGYVARSSQR